LENGTNYYRLKQVDFDGQFEYSDIVSVDYEVEKLNFSNIVTDELRFNETVKDVFLFDLQGRLLRQSSQAQSLNISELNSGIYILSIDGSNYRILKQ
jgi:hypothetical protein